MAIGIGIGLTFGRRKGIDAQAQAAFNSLQSAGFTTPQGITGINAAFKTIKTIYGTSDITTAISFFGDPSLAYQIGAGSGTTLGQAIRTLPNIIDPTRATDAVQTTAASQPLLLVHTGANYWQGVGVAFNYVTSPNAAANQITGDIEINAHFIHRTSGSEQIIIAKNQAATNQGYRIRITNGNYISFTISLDGSTLISVLSTFTLTNNQEIWVRCTRNSTTGVMNLFTSNDGITYTLNNTATNASGNIFATTTQLSIGANHNGASDTLHGKIYRATISNSIGGAPVVDFNPNQYNPSTSQTQWVSTSGETWTINTGTATSGYKGAVITRATIQSDGIDDRMTTTASRGNTNTQYTTFSALSADGTGDKIIIDATSANYRNSIAQVNNDIYLWINNAASNVLTAKTLRRIGLIITSNNAGVKNSIDLNNGTEATNAYTPTPSGTGISLFSRSDGGAGAFSNSLLTNYISSKTQDTTTQQTEMYNYIRSINGNSF